MAELAHDRPGANASRPREIPRGGWKAILIRAWKEAGNDNVGLIAAGVAFYGFLAFVPLLAALVLTYGLVADPATVADHLRSIAQLVPQDAAGLIMDELKQITATASGKQGFGLLLALLIAIYGAMRGASAIITALNTVYETNETRSFIRVTIVSAMLTVGALVALLLAIVAMSATGFIESLLPFSSPIVHFLLQVLFALAAAAAVSFGIALVYRYAPDRPNSQWRWLTPGSIAATALWLLATIGFAFYVSNFGSYNATYGSLGAVVVFLTWMYLSAYVVLMGGELNSELERQVKGRIPGAQ